MFMKEHDYQAHTDDDDDKINQLKSVKRWILCIYPITVEHIAYMYKQVLWQTHFLLRQYLCKDGQMWVNRSTNIDWRTETGGWSGKKRAVRQLHDKAAHQSTPKCQSLDTQPIHHCHLHNECWLQQIFKHVSCLCCVLWQTTAHPSPDILPFYCFFMFKTVYYWRCKIKHLWTCPE